MPYITEITSYISLTPTIGKELTLQMEIESGKKVQTKIAIDNHLEAFSELINDEISSLLLGYNVCNQMIVDKIIKNLPHELNRKIPNEILLAISLSIAKLASLYYDLPLFKYLGGIKQVKLPIVFFGNYPLNGYQVNDLNQAVELLIKTDKIEKVKQELSKATFLDLYSITTSSINNLHKSYPDLKFVASKQVNGAYLYFDVIDYPTISELLQNQPKFISTKFSDESLADIAVSLSVDYLIASPSQINRLIEIANLVK